MPRTSTTFTKGCNPGPGRPKGALAQRTIEVREFAARVIDDPGYQANLIGRIKKGQANHIESLLWFYRYGKPVERVEVRDDRPPVLVIGLQQPRHDPLALPVPRDVEQEADAQDDDRETVLDVSAIIERFEPKTSGIDRRPGRQSR